MTFRAPLLGACLALGAAFPQDEEPFRFTAELPEFQNAPMQIMLDYDPSNSLQGITVFGGTTDGDGTLQAELHIAEGQAFALLTERFVLRLWCEPGGTLGLAASEDSSFTASGSVADENQFLLDQSLALSSRMTVDQPRDFTRYAEAVDARTAAQREALVAVLEQPSASARFELYARAQIIGTATSMKNMHPRTLTKSGELPTNLPEDYFAFLESEVTFPLLSDEAAFLSRSYQNALQTKFQHLAKSALAAKGIEPKSDLGAWMRQELLIQGELLAKQPRTDELLYADKLDFMIQYLPAADTRGVLGSFANRFPDSPHLAPLRDRFLRSQSIDLASVDSAVEFEDAYGESVQLASLKGKVIYIDFWGLWCKGCMQNHPDFERLAEEYVDDDRVAFLSLNFYDEKDDWVAFVDEQKTSVLHWKPADRGHESKAEELFLLSSFPRYMLFGRDGELLSSSAPTPGSESIRQQIKDALRGPPSDR